MKTIVKNGHEVAVGNVGLGGVQPWSAGPIYPFTIVLIDNVDNGTGRVFAQWDKVILTNHLYQLNDQTSFFAAHAAATNDAKSYLASN